jgi:hypothetical protein
MDKPYTHEKKKKIADKITKITNKKDQLRLFKIIYEDNKQITENNNGLFMFFHKMNNQTYLKLEKELKKINKKKKYYIDSVNSESFSTEKKEYTPYTLEDFPSQKGISPKLKYSNKEKNLLKIQKYNNKITSENDPSSVYTSFNVSTFSESEKN